MRNIVQINTTAEEGGAGRVMSRLHRQYLSRGLNSWIINKQVDDPEQNIVSINKILDLPRVYRRIYNSIGGRIERWVGLPHFLGPTQKLLHSCYMSQADVIHFHNLHGHYLNHLLLGKFAEKKPIVWTLHDMWAFTGHCSYSYECQRWKSGCGECPLFSIENREKVYPPATLIDLTHFYWKLKRDAYNRVVLHIISPSKWLHKLAMDSFLRQKHTFHHIPNGIDLDIFRPVDKQSIRVKLRIPADLPVVLFMAENISLYRKGMRYLIQALRQLPNTLKIHLLIVGKKSFPMDSDLHFSKTILDLIKDENELNEVYNCADLFAFPSLADNHPLVALESMASGTPVIAFDTGGVPEIVRHLETGYIANYADPADFAHGIKLLIESPDMLKKMSQKSRLIALNEFSLDLQVDRHLSLYKEVIDRYGFHKVLS